MNKETNQSYEKGEPVRIIYKVGSRKEEIAIYSRTEPNHFVFTSLENPGTEIFVSRNHAELEKLTEKEKQAERKKLEGLVAVT